MSGYRNQSFIDGLMRGYGFVDDLRRKDEEAALRRNADSRAERQFGINLENHDYEVNSRPDAALARKAGEAGLNDTIGLAGFNAKDRATKEAGMLTPEQAALRRDAEQNDALGGFQHNAWERGYKQNTAPTIAQAQEGTNLELQGKREAIATARFNRAQPKNLETFGNPVDEVDGTGKKIRVQYGNRGTRRVVDGAIPAGKTGEMGVDAKRAETTLRGIGDTLSAYRALVEKHGSEIMPGPVKGKLTSAYANLQMELKNLYELGALTGPDVEVLGRMITPPDSTFANLNPRAQSQMLAQLDEVSNVIEEKKKAFSGTYGVQFPASKNGLQGAPAANGKYWKLWE